MAEKAMISGSTDDSGLTTGQREGNRHFRVFKAAKVCHFCQRRPPTGTSTFGGEIRAHCKSCERAPRPPRPFSRQSSSQPWTPEEGRIRAKIAVMRLRFAMINPFP
jgi:hypothetical protein